MATLARNPCFLFLRRREGWNVLFTNNIPLDISSLDVELSPIVVVTLLVILLAERCSFMMSNTVGVLWVDEGKAIALIQLDEESFELKFVILKLSYSLVASAHGAEGDMAEQLEFFLMMTLEHRMVCLLAINNGFIILNRSKTRNSRDSEISYDCARLIKRNTRSCGL